jgi:hypothetical protein
MYDLHQLGWHSFQQLCHTIVRDILGQTVKAFLDSNDAGRDGAFIGVWSTIAGEKYEGQFVIQCKFTSKPGALISLSDLNEEIPKVKKLTQKNLCDVYVLMTNAGLSGNQETQIYSALRDAGVKHILILGSTWIESQIRENSKLRMLVPRLYGLGDLSQILDERAYAQARAVLDSMRDELAKVVLTDSYRKAVEALNKYGFVLLIGEPAAGKTTIAGMLAMSAADNWKSSVLKLSQPSSVVEKWNVEEPSQFFWVDDAFGSTQYESPLAQGWNHAMLEVKAMLKRGSKIVMTSRNYIYNRARQDLKLSAFPLLSESQVVIDVHDLSEAEKQQILYNHLKLGGQDLKFRTNIKPFLVGIAAHERFIPETARRLADPIFTKDLILGKYFLDNFVNKREQLLFEIIDGLDAGSKAALGLIYMRKDRLESPIVLNAPETKALERLGSSIGECTNALNALDGSLVTNVFSEDQRVWRFKHPTIGDAYSETLTLNPDLLEIFLMGSATENLIAQITCGDVGIEGAIVVQKTLFQHVLARLSDFSHTHKYKSTLFVNWGLNRALYEFLSRRCSKEFLALYLPLNDKILDQITYPSYLSYSPEVDLVIRLNEYQLLDEALRSKFINRVIELTVEGEDTSALTNTKIQSVFKDIELQILFKRARFDLIPELGKIRRNLESNHDYKTPPEEYMEDLIETFNRLKERFSEDEDALEIIKNEQKKTDKWISETEVSEPSVSARKLNVTGVGDNPLSSRSIFDDIDAE